MITEQYKDKVFFSQWLRTDYPNIYKDVCEILDANNVAHETLPLTKDYWCRDYMPIQFACDRFSQFVYNPDYLRGKEKYITDVDKVMKKIDRTNLIVNHSSLVIDGGNIVVGEIERPNTYTTKSFIVMTDKVMKENKGLSKKEIESKIRDSFKPKECNSTIINALQTRDVIIVPGIGNTKLDNEAMSHFIALYPNYRGRIYQVQMKEFIEKWGGALNCCSWTISEDMSKLHHDIENEKRYNSIIAKYQKDSNSVCFDEIRFLGDYYPKKLENDNRELNRLYYGY